uniref:Right handed beta helix domain-containing protein n=1 Tax=Amphimedon queenslandica TaxID=400682 RepID=A0A1X7UXA8_AMPQE
MIIALLFLLLLQSCFLSTYSQQVLCVVHQDGVPNVTKSYYNCSLFANNLSSALQDVSDDTVLMLLNDEEIIDSIIEFANISGLSLFGMNGTNIVCSQQIVKYGLKFINVTNIRISEVTIINCGALYHYESNVTHQGVFSYHSSSAVYFENCTNIRINHINVSNSHGTGLTLYDSNGNVSIAHSTFTNNTVSRVDQELSTGRLLGGGGIYYELSMCSPSWDVCDPSTNLYNSHALLYVHNCTFYNNSVTTGSNNVEFSKYIGA